MNRDHTEELLKDLAEARKKKKKSHDSPNTPPGSPPYQPPPPSPPSGPSGTLNLLELLDHHKCHHHLLHFHPPTKKVNHIALSHQALQRQLPQLNIKLRQRLIQDSGRLSHQPLKISKWRMIWLPMHKYTRLMMKTSGMPIFLRVADLSILKMKAAYYLDVGLEQMVPDQMWIEEECKYDIAAIAVRTHMRILSVVIIEVFSMYGYDYMKKILLRRADLNEHIIAE
nr:hypothetical protein [Tanacetum cinerariifolium]